MSSKAINHHPDSYHGEEDDAEAALYARATLLITSTALPMALKAAIELNVLEIIAENGPDAAMTAEDIVSQIPSSNPRAAETLERILNFLVSHEVLTCSVDGGGGEGRKRFGLAPICRYFTESKDGVSMAALLLMSQHKVTLDSWQLLKDAVVEGVIPFAKAHGMNAFEYHGKDPEFNQVFNTAMSSHTTIMVEKMMRIYQGFEDIKVLVDVGGGIGSTLSMILAKYPNIKGINFDLPHVIAEAPIIEGVEHVRGDMFIDVPKGDAIFMKWILHDWSDDHCVRILQNCWKALPNSGKVIVVEGILPEVPDTSELTRISLFGDLTMLTCNIGGKERTNKEFESIAKQAGFSKVRAVGRVLNIWIMEFYK